MSEFSPAASAPLGGFAAISKYNPHLWSAEQLRSIFVARQNELADLLRTLRGTAADTVGQHTLLVGARGMGKSTLMQRLALEVEEDEALRQCWLPVRFPEEQYTVCSVSQFWANVLDWMIDALERRGLPTDALDAAAERIAALPVAEQAQACLSAIDASVDSHGQRLLLLVDNTDLLLRNIDRKEHWALRETLQSNPRLLWVGGSYQMLESGSDYHDAFLDFFRTIELRPLKLEEMQQALLALALTFGGEPAREAMQQQLDRHPERLPTLRQLSGGNPRTTVMLYALFANGHQGDVRRDLEVLLDEMTPLYKARMDALAEQQCKLLAHVLEHWAPISLGVLAEVSQIPKGTISGQLARLEQEGLIERAALHGTTRSGYQAAERFFNIWYLMRFSPRRQRVRLSWLVEFMRLWFSPDELCGMARQRMNGVAATARCSHDWDYDRALSDALPEDQPERHGLRWAMLKQLQANRAQLQEIFDLDGVDQEFRGADDYLRRLQALPPKLRECPHLHTEEERQHWVTAVMGSFSLSLEEKERVAAAVPTLSLSQVSELQQVFANEVQDLQAPGCFGEDWPAVHAAILRYDLFPDMPDSHLAFEQIRPFFPGHPQALWLLCDFLYKAHKDEWCLKAHQLLQRLQPEDAQLAQLCGWLLHVKLGRYAEAEAAYRQAIALDEKDALPWNNLGKLLEDHLGRYAEAEAAYRQAIVLDEKNAWPWSNLGSLLQEHLGRYAEAEAAYRQAIALDEKVALPWNGLGNLLQYHLGLYPEAEAAYRQAIALDEKYAAPWNNLGNLLKDHLGRYAEAETAYRQAIELNPEDGYAKGNLARLLWQQGQLQPALQQYRAVVNCVQSDEQNLILQAHLCLDNHQLGVDALLALVSQAQAGNQRAFFKIKEQVWECHEMGLGLRLADWMAGCEQAVFLTPFIQALYMLAGADEKLQDLPLETQQMADEVVRVARQRAEARAAAQAGAH